MSEEAQTQTTGLQAELTGSWLPILRLCIAFPIFGIILVLSFLLRLLLLPFPRHIFLRYNTRLVIYPFSKLLFRVAGTKLKVDSKVKHSNQLMVSHHQGVMDSLMMMAMSPCMVISSSDIRNMKGIGWVMEQLGFVFVNRTRHRSIPKVLEPTIMMMSKSKINIAFFPEGRSNDGQEMLSFRPPFFRIATASGADVQPVAFHYALANGKPVSRDDIEFFVYVLAKGSVVTYVFNLLRVRSLELWVKVLDPIPGERIKTEEMTRKDLSQAAEAQIRPPFYDRFNWVKSQEG